MAVQSSRITSSSLAHSYQKPHPSITHDFQGISKLPLPPYLCGPNLVNTGDFFTTSNQYVQKCLSKCSRQKEMKYLKPLTLDNVDYLKNFCEGMLRQNKIGKFAKSETTLKFDEKIKKEFVKPIESNWNKKIDLAEDENLREPIERYKEELKNLEGIDHFEKLAEPYMSTFQRDFRHFKRKELEEKTITIYDDIRVKRPHENKLKIDKIGKVLKEFPCQMDEARRTDGINFTPPPKVYRNRSFPWKISLNHQELEDKLRQSLDELRMKKESPVLEALRIPNFYRTQNSYYGSGDLVIVQK